MTDIVDMLRQGSLTRDDYRWKAADEITRLTAEVEDLSNRLHHVHRLWANNEHALRAEIARLTARVAELEGVGNAVIDFYEGPLELKRPDIFHRLMVRLNAALTQPTKETADE